MERLRLAALVTGAALLLALVGRVGPSVLLDQLRALGPAWLAVATVSLGWMLANAWAWGLAAGSPRPEPGLLLRAHLSGEALNNLTPLAVAGEPLRVALLAETTGWPRALASGVGDAVVHLASGALYLALATLCAPRLPGALSAALAVAALVLLAASAAAWRLAAGHRLPRWLPDRWIRRVPGEATRHLRAFLQGGDAGLSLLAHLAGRLLGAAEAWLILDALGTPITPAGALVLIGGMHVAGNLLFAFVPGQLGVQEGLAWLLAAALGLPPASALALALARRVRSLAWTAAGLLLLARR